MFFGAVSSKIEKHFWNFGTDKPKSIAAVVKDTTGSRKLIEKKYDKQVEIIAAIENKKSMISGISSLWSNNWQWRESIERIESDLKRSIKHETVVNKRSSLLVLELRFIFTK